MIPGEDRRGMPKPFDPVAFRNQVHCPDGCVPGTEDCDEHGYCEHLVGFSDDLQVYRPIVRRTRVDKDGNVVMKNDQPEATDYRFVSNQKLPLEPGDVCVRISQTYRVYRPTGMFRSRTPGEVVAELPDRVVIKGSKKGRKEEVGNVG